MATRLHREPWNKGIIVGQKAPLKLKEVWAIRMRLQLAHRGRELALFQPGRRQQAACLRPSPAASLGRLPRRSRGQWDDRQATKDSPAGSV